MKFIDLFTDAENRPEIKAVLGIITILTAFVWLFVKTDVGGFLAIFGAGAVLLGIKTVEDANLDHIRAGK